MDNYSDGKAQRYPLKNFELFLLICVLGLVIEVGYHFILEKYFGLGWPFNSFLWKPEVRFTDFFIPVFNFGKSLLDGQFVYDKQMWNNYMPLSNYVFAVFGIGNFPWLNLSVYYAIVVGGFAWFSYTLIKRSFGTGRALIYTLILIVTSYPLVWLLDRGNFEGLQFVILIAFTYCFINKRYFWSALFLALSINFKPFSIVFIVLFLSEKKFKEIILFLIISATLFFFSLVMLPGGFFLNLKYWLVDLDRYNVYFVYGNDGYQFNHTLYSPVFLMSKWLQLDIKSTAGIYFYIIAAFFLLLSFYIIKYETKEWRKFLLLFLTMVGFPFVSCDYTLINMYIPILLFFFAADSGFTDITVLLGLLMLPKQYFVSFDVYWGLSVIFNPIIIALIIILLATQGLKEHKLQYAEMKNVTVCG